MKKIALILNIILILCFAAGYSVLSFSKPERLFLAPEFMRFATVVFSALLLGISLSARGGRLRYLCGRAIITLAAIFCAFTAACGAYCYEIRSLNLVPDLQALVQGRLAQAAWYIWRYIFNEHGLPVFCVVFLLTFPAAWLAASVIRKNNFKAGSAAPGRMKLPVRLLPAGLAVLFVFACYNAGNGLIADAVREGYAAQADYSLRWNEYYATLKTQTSGPESGAEQKNGGLASGVAKFGRDELHVLIIGASEDRNYLSAWGAPLDTTPWLSKAANLSPGSASGQASGPILFANSFCAGGHPANNLHFALTGKRMVELAPAHASGKPDYDTARSGSDEVAPSARTGSSVIFGGPASANVIGAARAAGLDVVWLSNRFTRSQSFKLEASGPGGGFELVGAAPERGWPEPDEVLLPFLDSFLRARFHSGTQESNGGRGALLVLQLGGSAYPYGSRFPRDFKMDLPTGSEYLGKMSGKPPLLSFYRDYMTSLRYTDSLLERIFLRFGKEAEAPASVVYFADRGEDFYQRHAPGAFAWPLVEIPAWVWLSDSYRALYPERYENLRRNASGVFTSDLIYDLFMGLSGLDSLTLAGEEEIDTAKNAPKEQEGFAVRHAGPAGEAPVSATLPVARPVAPRQAPDGGTYDISSGSYALTVRNGVLDNGRPLSAAPEFLIRSRLQNPELSHLGVHGCNSVLKTWRAVSYGARRIELDAVFNGDSERPRLMLGHDDGHMTNLDLERFLDLFADKLEFIWLDIKNVSPETNRQILAALERLDKLHSIRDRCLIESKKPESLDVFAENGWETSYYLLWKRVRSAIADGRSAEFAADIANLAERKGLGGISYALVADQNVQQHLMPLLPANMKNYCWAPIWSFMDNDLETKAGAYRHLRSLLVEIATPFEVF